MSYTQRRYFAHAEQRRREGAGPSPDTPPPDMMLAHSFRASWGPGGTLVFGSRSVRMVQVAPDAAAGNGGDAESTRQRAKATLGVEREAKRFAAGGDPPPLAVLAREHKLATATAASSQAALQEAHAWKLVSALLDGAAHQAGGAAMGEAGEALAHVRQREAVCAWLRLAMWDTAAQELQEGGSAAARVWSLATSLHATEAARAALAGEEGGGGEGGGEGGRAYLAALLATPVSEVQEDMRAQLAHWRQHGAPAAAHPRTEAAAALLPRIFELLAGAPPHLPTSPHISPHLPTSPHISPYLRISPHISAYLRISPHTSQYLPISPYTSPGETTPAEADMARDGRGTCG